MALLRFSNLEKSTSFHFLTHFSFKFQKQIFFLIRIYVVQAFIRIASEIIIISSSQIETPWSLMNKIREIIAQNRQRKELWRLDFEQSKISNFIIHKSNNTIIKPYLVDPTATIKAHSAERERQKSVRLAPQDKNKNDWVEVSRRRGYQKLSLNRSKVKNMISYRGTFSLSLGHCEGRNLKETEARQQSKNYFNLVLPKRSFGRFQQSQKQQCLSQFEPLKRDKSPRIRRISDRRVVNYRKKSPGPSLHDRQREIADIIGWQTYDQYCEE